MRAELVVRDEELERLAPAWDRLACNDARDGFFRTSAWYRAWIAHIRPDARPFVVVVRDDRGDVVGLAPFCLGPYRSLGFRLRSVMWGGREVVSGDFLNWLAEPAARPQANAAILEFLAVMRSEWGLLVAGELIDGGESYSALQSLAERNGWLVRRQEERICPYIALPGTFEEYLNTLGSSTRYHIRRRIRDVVEKGSGRVEVYSQPQEVSSRLDALIRLHLARWRKDNLPGTLARPGFGEFLRQVCTSPPAGSGCRLYLLTADGAPAAALLTFHFGQSALYYQAGWDPGSPLAAQSPGVVLMAHSIRDAIEKGLRYYEFLRGDEAYKLRWTKTFRTTSTLLLARSFMAKQYLRTARFKDLLKSCLRPRGGTAPILRQEESTK